MIAIDKHRKDPQAPERYGAGIISDFEAKPRIVRDSARFELARSKIIPLQTAR